MLRHQDDTESDLGSEGEENKKTKIGERDETLSNDHENVQGDGATWVNENDTTTDETDSNFSDASAVI